MTLFHQTTWQLISKEQGGLKLANLVSLSRLVLIIPVVVLLLTDHDRFALLVMVIAATTDLLDGWIARRTGRSSQFGAQLDAVVDNIFSLAILGFLLLAYPGLLNRHGVALAVVFISPLLYLALSYGLSRRFMMFHFWSAKIGAVLVFCLWPLIALTHSEMAIPITAAVIVFSRSEQLVFILRGGNDLNAAHGFSRVDHSCNFKTTT